MYAKEKHYLAYNFYKKINSKKWKMIKNLKR